MKKCVIWGTGNVGKYLVREILEKKEYEIHAYCDNNKSKWGTYVNNIQVISPKELWGMAEEKQIDSIILALNNKEAIKQIWKILSTQISNQIKIIDWCSLQNEYLIRLRKQRVYQYTIDFEKQLELWIQNYMTEVRFWKEQVIYSEGEYHDNYLRRLKNTDFLGLDNSCTCLLPVLKSNSIVMDIGCGLVSMYGNVLPDSQKIQLQGVDPLAAFYNKFNERYCGEILDKRCEFGIFEFIADFFDEGYCDAIIINNALDHCIDPYKSIIECLYILKKKGRMHLNHRVAEAVREAYCGLHRWNIDYDDENNFIIWNEEGAINVSKELASVATFKVSYDKNCLDRMKQWIVVDIEKQEDFKLDQFVDMKKEYHNLAIFIKKLMYQIADNEK